MQPIMEQHLTTLKKKQLCGKETRKKTLQLDTSCASVRVCVRGCVRCSTWVCREELGDLMHQVELN